jgi:hypothetical protein
MRLVSNALTDGAVTPADDDADADVSDVDEAVVVLWSTSFEEPFARGEFTIRTLMGDTWRRVTGFAEWATRRGCNVGVAFESASGAFGPSGDRELSLYVDRADPCAGGISFASSSYACGAVRS